MHRVPTGTRAAVRELAAPVSLAIVVGALTAWVGLRTMAFTDYESEVEPALLALRAGHVEDFLLALPSYGGSVILRLPFVALPDLWGGGDLALFRSMAVPCLAAGAALGVFLWHHAVRHGAGLWSRVAVLVLCTGNPLTLRALEIGHPEELLGAVLCVAAVLAAGGGRPVIAGALLGLAVANKPWAVLAVAPVLIALSAGRLRALAAAGVAGGVVLMPLALLEGSALAQASAVARDSGQIFQPWQVWWFLGDHGQVVSGLFTDKPGYRTAPGWLGPIARPLVIGVPLVLSLIVAGRLRRRPWHDALLLLAFVLLLRCLLDPWNVVYYELPFLLALVAWEVHARPGFPAVTVAATLACWVTLEQMTSVLSPDLQAALFLAWSVPLAGAMFARLAFDLQHSDLPRLRGSRPREQDRKAVGLGEENVEARRREPLGGRV